MTLKNNIVDLSEINLDEYTFFKGKAQTRQNFFSNDGQLYLKLWNDDFENKDVVARCFDVGYFDEQILPNFLNSISYEGINRGYILKRVKNDQVLDNIVKKFSYKNIILNIAKPSYFFKSKFKLDQGKLIAFLHNIFEKALRLDLMFMELNSRNIWTSERGYHIFDLDSVKHLDWYFVKDVSEQQFIRRKIHLQQLNKHIRELISQHGLKIPKKRILGKEDIGLFWEEFFKVNSFEASYKDFISLK